MDKPQRGRVDAITQPAAILGSVGKHVAEMAVRVRRAHLSAEHTVRGVPQFVDILRFNGLGEAGPAASRIKLVGRREQRLAGHDIDVDSRFLVIQIFSGSGGLGAVLLRYVILLGRELLNCVVVLAEIAHLFSPYQTYTKVLSFSVTLALGMRIMDDDLDRMDREGTNLPRRALATGIPQAPRQFRS